MIPYKGQIRFANLENRQVLTVNMGKSKHGFNICRCCGGAEVADPKNTGKIKVTQPFHNNAPVCRHDMIEQEVYLGYEFLTDMFIFLKICLKMNCGVSMNRMVEALYSKKKCWSCPLLSQTWRRLF